MLVNYNGQEYYYKDSITVSEFEKSSLIFPISGWQEMANQIFGDFTLESAKNILKRQLDIYNEDACKFLYNGIEYWLGKTDRTSILLVLESMSGTFTLILKREMVEIDVEKMKQFLQDLNVFSYECLVLYNKYILQIDELEEIKDLDFVFPEKLSLNNYL